MAINEVYRQNNGGLVPDIMYVLSRPLLLYFR